MIQSNIQTEYNVECRECHKFSRSESLACGNCGMVTYCCPTSKRRNWPTHKLVCHESLESKERKIIIAATKKWISRVPITTLAAAMRLNDPKLNEYSEFKFELQEDKYNEFVIKNYQIHNIKSSNTLKEWAIAKGMTLFEFVVNWRDCSISFDLYLLVPLLNPYSLSDRKTRVRTSFQKTLDMLIDNINGKESSLVEKQV